jgi:hypothetical protein
VSTLVRVVTLAAALPAARRAARVPPAVAFRNQPSRPLRPGQAR